MIVNHQIINPRHRIKYTKKSTHKNIIQQILYAFAKILKEQLKGIINCIYVRDVQELIIGSV